MLPNDDTKGPSPAHLAFFDEMILDGCDDPRPDDPDIERIRQEAQAMMELAYGKD